MPLRQPNVLSERAHSGEVIDNSAKALAITLSELFKTVEKRAEGVRRVSLNFSLIAVASKVRGHLQGTSFDYLSKSGIGTPLFVGHF
jgi:hypothetical protein